MSLPSSESISPQFPPSLLQVTILTSLEDIASSAIRLHILKSYAFAPSLASQVNNLTVIKAIDQYEYRSPKGTVLFSLMTVDVPLIRLDEFVPPAALSGDIIIFASRHQAQSARDALLCHTNGNWNQDTSVGGQPFQIARGSGILLYYLYTGMLSRVKESSGFQVPVDQEVNHHGPTGYLQPSAYIELGSTESGWRNPHGAQIVADTIINSGINLLDHYQHGTWEKHGLKICVGIGGGHYMPSFSPLIPSRYTFVHTIPKYKIFDITSTMVSQILQQSLEPIDAWVIDWKGLNSAEKQHILPLLEASQLPILKTHELRKGVIPFPNKS